MSGPGVTEWTPRKFPKTRYHVRAWGSDHSPDLNYETTSLPTKLHLRYPFVDIQPLERKPEPIKDFPHGQAQAARG